YKLNILKEIANFMLKDVNELLFNHYDKFNNLASDQFNTIIVETLLYERRNQNTKINNAITFSMNEISILNDAIINIEAQLKDIHNSVEESINLLEENINIDGI
ncbi:17877_t:CDS:2, partial [Gigaspora margarita]